MRHLIITEPGCFVGLQGARLQVRKEDSILAEVPLSRLRTVVIEREGISLSSNIMMACAQRGIRLYLTDWRGRQVVSVSGLHQHATVAVRERQFACRQSPAAARLAAQIVHGKLANQRAVLKYFGKYPEANQAAIQPAAERIAGVMSSLRERRWEHMEGWREALLGHEGTAARFYWDALAEAGLLTTTFAGREGRGSMELGNQMLNYGYAMLNSLVWSALENAGLEPFCGLLHQPRPGKPALVLDMMEIYRPWVVDRSVIKLRRQASGIGQLTPALKKRLAQSVQASLASRHLWRKKRLRLDTIIQRQAYQLAGAMVEEKPFRPYRFRW